MVGCLPETPRNPSTLPKVHQGLVSELHTVRIPFPGGSGPCKWQPAMLGAQVEKPTGKRVGFQLEASTMAGHWTEAGTCPQSDPEDRPAS